MRSFQERLPDFDARGIRIAAISVDPPETTREHVAKMGFAFTFLSDPQAEAIRRYDLLHVGGAETGDIARPAEFLIDPSGSVRWVHLTGNYWVRAHPEAVLDAFDELAGAAPSPASP